MKKFQIPLDILDRWLDAIQDFPFKDAQTAKYSGEAMFVRGTLSSYVPDGFLGPIRQFFPRSEVVGLEAGHWVISEGPMQFLDGEPSPTRTCRFVLLF